MANEKLSPWLQLHVKKIGRDCLLECGPEKDCHPDTCCGKKVKDEKKNGVAQAKPAEIIDTAESESSPADDVRVSTDTPAAAVDDQNSLA